tara:strand:- start:428 stop:610 length:183 start_codon:yes stop_codon:yes gene_type:complete
MIMSLVKEMDLSREALLQHIEILEKHLAKKQSAEKQLKRLKKDHNQLKKDFKIITNSWSF